MVKKMKMTRMNQLVYMDIPCSNDGKENENDEDKSTGMDTPSTDNLSEYETPLYDASGTPDSELKSLDDDPSPDFVPGSGSDDSSLRMMLVNVINWTTQRLAAMEGKKYFIECVPDVQC